MKRATWLANSFELPEEIVLEKQSSISVLHGIRKALYDMDRDMRKSEVLILHPKMFHILMQNIYNNEYMSFFDICNTNDPRIWGIKIEIANWLNEDTIGIRDNHTQIEFFKLKL